VQGRIRGEALSLEITTECAHTHRPMRIRLDSDLRYEVLEGGSQPLVYVPMVNFSELKDPSIIDAF
jgi:hypothetical protein